MELRLKGYHFFAVYPRVSLDPGPYHVIEGSDVTLPKCLVTGYPTPVVTWRKSSGQLPQGRAHYNNSVLQISDVRKSDSDWYFCSAVNLLENIERKILLVVISPPVFTIKPPGKAFAATGDTLTLKCSATGDPRPVINWKRQGAALPVGRSERTNDALIIRDFRVGDVGIYICVATSAGVFHTETISDIEAVKGKGTGKLHCVNEVVKLFQLKRELIPRSPIRKKKSQPAQTFCFLVRILLVRVPFIGCPNLLPFRSVDLRYCQRKE